MDWGSTLSKDPNKDSNIYCTSTYNASVSSPWCTIHGNVIKWDHGRYHKFRRHWLLVSYEYHLIQSRHYEIHVFIDEELHLVNPDKWYKYWNIVVWYTIHHDICEHLMPHIGLGILKKEIFALFQSSTRSLLKYLKHSRGSQEPVDPI